MGVYVVRKWPLPVGEESICVLQYHTVSSWLLCNVHFVQSICPNWPRWPKGTNHCSSEEYRCTHVGACVWQELEYRIDVCRVTRGAHTDTSLVVNKQVSMELLIDVKSFRPHYFAGVDSASNTKWVPRVFPRVKAAGVYGWQIYHYPVPLSWNLGTIPLM